MSVVSSGSQAGDRQPESCHCDDVEMPDDYRTPSPPAQQDDSYDENTPPQRSAQSGSIWITPSQRSNLASISTSAQTALEKLYKRIYGPHSVQCLLTQGSGSLTVAHAVKRMSKSFEVSYICAKEERSDVFQAHAVQILPWV